MRFARLACLDDLARETFWPAKEFFYDLVRAPIHFASGLDIAKSPRNGQRHNLKPAFDEARFLSLAGLAQRAPASGSLPAGRPWQAVHQRLPDAASDYLRAHVDPDTLVLGYEMPPWLRRALGDGGIAWLDMRVAPLRFGSDLYVGLASNDPALRQAIGSHALAQHTVLAEACLMVAKVRYRLRYRDDNLALDGQVVYIGQTGEDASLLDADGHYVRAGDRAEALRAFVGDAPLHYKPHPYAGPFAAEECAALSALLGREAVPCDVDTYDLLAGDADVRLVGISSGVLQEASWFGKTAEILFEPLCKPSFELPLDAEQHRLVAAHDFLSEPLWASVLDCPARPSALHGPSQGNRLPDCPTPGAATRPTAA